MHLQLSRRGFHSWAAGSAMSGWFGRLAAHAAEQPQAKSCILLWMNGGPSHLDTFDLKPDAKSNVRGDFKPIETSVPGIKISEHFPLLAKQMKHVAILRGMSTVESDHQLATYHLHTGYQKRAGGTAFPSLGISFRENSDNATSRCLILFALGPQQGTQRGLAFSGRTINRSTL